MIMDGGDSDTEIVAVETVESEAARTRRNIQLETFQNNGPTARLNHEQISINVIIDVCGTPGGLGWN